MIDFNELRRLAQAATPGPWKMLPVGDGRQKFTVANSEFLSILTVTDEGGATFGTVYDDADARFIAAANPATITEILDRLEDAESDALEQARLNGMGASREAALMAKLEAAEKSDAESIAMYRIGGPFIAEDPNCPIHGYEAQAREKEERAYRESEEEKQNELLARIIALEEKIDAMPQCTQPAPSISPVALCHVIQWLRNGCDPMKAADELEMLAAAPEAKP